MSLNLTKTASRIVLGATALLLTTTAFAQDLRVDINRTQVVYLPTVASAVVIGNPEIADVSVHSADTLFVVGRGYGETNLIVLDQAGQQVMDANITVSNSTSSSSVRLHNLGDGRQTYSCTPYCAPAPVLGDAPGFVGTYSGGGARINNTSATGPITSAPTPQMMGSQMSGASSAGRSQGDPAYSSMSAAQSRYMSRNDDQ